MVVIREEQMEKFSDASYKSFENRMLIHLSKYFPEHYKALGEEKSRELIKYGIKRAAIYEIIAERDVCKYIDLMVSFGVEFDTDPKLPWANEILTAPSWKNPSAKTEKLFKTGIDHLQRKSV